MKKKSGSISEATKSILAKRILPVLLAVVLTVTGIPGNLRSNEKKATEVQAATTLSNPRISTASSMEAGKKVTWDCIWFGSYPQTEIVDKAETSGAYGKDWTTSSDFEVNPSLYSTLKSASGWNSSGDITISGVKYRRIKSSDATYAASGSSGYFNWSDSDTYHYFRYDKIKWRVLKTSGSSAFLVADKALDDQKYNEEDTDVTWATSTIRTWLNKTFLGNAFSSSEQGAIQTTSVVNNNNINYDTAGGANTSDKVFLLSEAEVYTVAAKSYGFVSVHYTYDEARRCKSSTYSKAMGTYANWGSGAGYDGNCSWWLRSPGKYTNYAAYVNCLGSVIYYGLDVNYINDAVRPALNLNLSSSNLWSYAGTVCSDGTVNEEGSGESGSGSDGEDKYHSFKCVNDEYQGDCGFVFSDDYFSKPASTYNHSLATMSLCLAFSSYGYEDKNDKYRYYDQNVYNAMKECGLVGEDTYQQYNYRNKPQKDSIACAIGSKSLDDNTSLIAVAVRSGGYETEWASNLSPGVLGDHNGFDESAGKVKRYIEQYIAEKKKLLHSNIKIWITGFSRGAAVATQTAAKMDREGVSGTNCGKDDIYAYGFATPAGAVKISNPHGTLYNNIFNIIDFNDPVPLVAPNSWHFERYGTTMIFPYELGSKKDNTYLAKVKERMRNMSAPHDYKLNDFEFSILDLAGNTLTSFYRLCNNREQPLGLFNRRLINDVAKGLMNRSNYVLKHQAFVTTGLDFSGGAFNAISGSGMATVIIELLNNIPPLEKVIVATAIKNKGLLAEVHANPQYYIAWMQTMDSNYPGNLPVKWGRKNYRASIFNCPVDVNVYDSSNELVASIVDEEPVYIEDSPVLSMIDEKDQKIVYLPTEGDYDVQVVPREECTMTCSVNEYDADSGTLERDVVYSDINMNKDDKVVMNCDAFTASELSEEVTEGSNVSYEIKKNGVTIDSTYDLKGQEEIDNNTYEVTVKYDETMGSVYGQGAYIKGSFAKMSAESKPGYKFMGFFVGGKQLEDDDLDKHSDTVRFEVKKDVLIEARFEHQTSEKETTSGGKLVGKITLSGISHKIAAGRKLQLKAQVLPKGAKNKKLKWTSSNPKVATVNQKGLVVIKKKTGGKSAVITATATDGSGKKATWSIKVMKGVVKKITIKGKKKVKAGKALKLKAKIKATKGANKKLKWTSNNTKFAIVNGSGKVKTLKAGKGVYYARADHFARSIKSPFSDLQVSCLGHKVSYLELFVNGLNRVNPVQAKRI